MHPALEFIDQLDPSPDATFCIETYTDAPKGAAKPKPDPMSKRYHGCDRDRVKDLIPELEARNEQGAGIFIAVNDFPANRRKADIRRVRGIHADCDDQPLEVINKIRETLKPTLEVQSSSPTNVHFYWLLEVGEEINTEEAEAMNKQLVSMGADKAAIDVSRLLRLPGFRHMKKRGGDSHVR